MDTVEGAALPDLDHECTGSVNPRFGIVVEGVKQRPGRLDLAGRLGQRLGHHGAGHDKRASIDLTVEAKRLPPTQEGRQVERGLEEQEVGLLLPLWKRAQPGRGGDGERLTAGEGLRSTERRASSSMVRTFRSLERDPEAGRSPKTHRKRSTPYPAAVSRSRRNQSRLRSRLLRQAIARTPCWPPRGLPPRSTLWPAQGGCPESRSCPCRG